MSLLCNNHTDSLVYLGTVANTVELYTMCKSSKYSLASTILICIGKKAIKKLAFKTEKEMACLSDYLTQRYPSLAEWSRSQALLKGEAGFSYIKAK